MVWKAEELPSRLRVASVVGKRTEKEATELVSKVKERSDGTIPLFVSDNLDSSRGERQPDVEADELEAREGRPIIQQGDGGAAVPDRTGRRGPQLPEASRFAEDEAQEAAADEGEERDAKEVDAENPCHGGRDYWPQVDHGRADDLSNHQILPLRDSIKSLNLSL